MNHEILFYFCCCLSIARFYSHRFDYKDNLRFATVFLKLSLTIKSVKSVKSKGLNTPLQMLNEQRKEKKVQSCDKWR
jgi:hypothetical protein